MPGALFWFSCSMTLSVSLSLVCDCESSGPFLAQIFSGLQKATSFYSEASTYFGGQPCQEQEEVKRQAAKKAEAEIFAKPAQDAKAHVTPPPPPAAVQPAQDALEQQQLQQQLLQQQQYQQQLQQQQYMQQQQMLQQQQYQQQLQQQQYQQMQMQGQQAAVHSELRRTPIFCCKWHSSYCFA